MKVTVKAIPQKYRTWTWRKTLQGSKGRAGMC